MSPERWRQVAHIYHSALVKTGFERSTYLHQACGNDAELVREVNALLHQEESSASGVSQPFRAADVPEMQPGARMGPYEVLELIGAGGMGKVYKARDTRLDRTVAIKVSVAGFDDRFEREARAVAALNHPNICALYDVGPDYLVMEYIDGVKLAGPLPLSKAIEYAVQIADALDSAHRKGIVHRDLKPGNILVTRIGVKLLDFGLAKLEKPAESEEHTITEVGALLGTPHYMSPEQLQGKEVTPRSDIFSFGLVLYQMITGQRAFDAMDRASVTAAILLSDPPSVASHTSEPTAIPPALERIVKRCLVKDPELRWQCARDLMLELAEVEGPLPTAAPAAGRPRVWSIAALLAVALATLAGTLAYVRYSGTANQQSAARTWKVALNPPPGVELPLVGTFNMATPEISPDGSMVVAVIGDALHLRRMNATRFTMLRGTEGASQPFWSPDSLWIGYTLNGKIMRMQVPDGAPDAITDVSIYIKGATWNKRGEMLIAADGLRIAPAGGGPARPLDEADPQHPLESPFWPHFLPDGEHFVFSARDPSQPENATAERGIYLAAWGDGHWKQKPVLLKSNLNEARYSALHGGCLLYVQNDNLYAQRVSVTQGRLDGVPELVQTQIASAVDLGASHFSVSDGGVLAWRSGRAVVSQLTWFDREGTITGTAGPPGSYFRVELSPDAQRVATVNMWGDVPEYRVMESGQVSFLRIARSNRNITLGGGLLWSRDNEHILYRAKKPGIPGATLVEHRTNTSGETREIGPVPDGFPGFLDDITADRKYLLLWQDTVSVVPLGPGAKPSWPLESSDRTFVGMFSPDARWVVYQGGNPRQIFVQQFPEAGARRQISAGNGSMPFWRDDGKEILYLSDKQQIMSVPVDLARGEFAPARILFGVRPPPSTRVTRIYAATRDGSRILFSQLIEQPDSKAIFVAADWEAGLKK